MFSKEEYEGKINGSELFLIKRENNPDYYDTLERKLLDDLCNYYNYCISSNVLTNYGLEFFLTAKSCICTFDETKGVTFLSYFASSFKTARKKAYATQVLEDAKGGMHIRERDKLLISKVISLHNYYNSLGEKCEMADEDFMLYAARKLDMPYEKIEEIVILNEKTKAIRETTITEDDELISVFDTIGSEDNNFINLENAEAFVEKLDEIDAEFSCLQERTKPLLRELFTALVIKQIDNVYELKHYECFDAGIIDGYIRYRRIPSAKEIAEKYGVFEASASRTLKNFIGKLKIRL